MVVVVDAAVEVVVLVVIEVVVPVVVDDGIVDDDVVEEPADPLSSTPLVPHDDATSTPTISRERARTPPRCQPRPPEWWHLDLPRPHRHGVLTREGLPGAALLGSEPEGAREVGSRARRRPRP